MTARARGGEVCVGCGRRFREGTRVHPASSDDSKVACSARCRDAYGLAEYERQMAALEGDAKRGAR